MIITMPNAHKLVIGGPGRVLKKRVSGFDFKKPGYPGSGFQKNKIWCDNHDFFHILLINFDIF